MLIKCICTLNMRTMPTVRKNLHNAMGSAFRFLGMRYWNHRIGITPDDQHWSMQLRESVAQICLLLPPGKGGIDCGNERGMCACLHALLVKLFYQRLLNHARLSEKVGQFRAQTLASWRGTHQIEYCATNLRPQSATINQYQPLDSLWIRSGKAKSEGSAQRVTDDAYT